MKTGQNICVYVYCHPFTGQEIGVAIPVADRIISRREADAIADHAMKAIGLPWVRDKFFGLSEEMDMPILLVMLPELLEADHMVETVLIDDEEE